MTQDMPAVREYMTSEVSTVGPGATVAEVARRITESDGFSGFPVTEGTRVTGFVTARDLLAADDDTEIRRVMSDDLIVAHPEMTVHEAARVILRSGIQKLPVVNDDDELIGIISNTDAIRSHIERATPDKVNKLARTLADIHGVTTEQQRRTADLMALTPTQETVYADELDGRVYELERGLAEPPVCIDNGGTLVLADGHHRLKAAQRLGINEIEVTVIVLGSTVELGMAQTAEEKGLETIDDIEIVDYARHPLVQQTERLRDQDDGDT
jgi:IMP dehydrogenase